VATDRYLAKDKNDQVKSNTKDLTSSCFSFNDIQEGDEIEESIHEEVLIEPSINEEIYSQNQDEYQDKYQVGCKESA